MDLKIVLPKKNKLLANSWFPLFFITLSLLLILFPGCSNNDSTSTTTPTTTQTPLAGSWYTGGSSDIQSTSNYNSFDFQSSLDYNWVLTFLENNYVILVFDNSDESASLICMERGTYQHDPQTNAFDYTTTDDTCEDIGLSEFVDPIITVGDEFLYIKDEGNIVLTAKKLESSTNKLIGSWYFGNTSLEDKLGILTFLNGTTYTFVQDGNIIKNSDGSEEAELGAYSVNDTKNLRIDPTLTSDADAGISGLQNPTIDLRSGYILTLTDTDSVLNTTFFQGAKIESDKFWDIPTCRSLGINPSIDYVDSYIDQRIATGDLSRVKPEWGPYSDFSIKAIKRGYMIPCEPEVDPADADSDINPDNIKQVMKILTPARWEELTNSLLVNELQYHATNFPPVDQASFSYENFLKSIAKYPYFCGEKGYFDSIEAACIREISAVFAHGAQETGGDATPKWKNAFAWSRENTKPDDARYDPTNPNNDPCSAPFNCPEDVHYFGRGIKQLSYFFNYAGFSSAIFGNDFNFLLSKPDLVGSDGKLAFGSGLWFFMTPQPPKPSMHEILLGIYTPNGPAAGIEPDPVTGVKYNFEITISAINGAVECGVPGTEDDQKGINRSEYYISLIEFFGGTPTDQEKAKKGCSHITKGDIFGSNSSLSYQPTTWTNFDNCTAIGWQPRPPLSLIFEGITNACLNK